MGIIKKTATVVAVVTLGIVGVIVVILGACFIFGLFIGVAQAL
jgi:hypothetical protein